MVTYQKCECGALFEPTTCIVCQEERWAEEIENWKSSSERYREALVLAGEALEFMARYYFADGRDAREVVKQALKSAV